MHKLLFLSFGILSSAWLSGAENVIELKLAEKYNRELGVAETKDRSAENGRAYSFDGRRGGWSLAFFPMKAFRNQKPEGEWEIYARLRCDASADSGTAFFMGLYSYRKKQDLLQRRLQVPEIRGKEYRTVLIGKTRDLDAELWAGGPARTSGVETIYLEKIILRKAEKPALPTEFRNRKTVQLQKFRFDSKRASEVVDFHASDRLACRVRGNTPSWSIFLPLSAENMKRLGGERNWEIYLELRAEGEAVTGSVFEFGLYNQKQKKHLMNKKISMEYIKDSKYQLEKIGTGTIPDGSYFWGGALNNSQVDAIYVDRIILVEKEQEKNK